MALTRITKGVIKPNENYDTHDINSTGIITAIGGNITGNLTVGGVLTYEDVSSIDAVGIITANQGIHVGAGISAVGVGTFSGLDISGDIDVDGHTNLDNVSIAGVTTASDNVIIPDNKKLVLGSLSGRQLHLYHNTSGSSNHVIESTSSSNHFILKATTINPRADTFSFRNHAHNKNVFRVLADTSTTLYYNGNTKLTTENTGVNITGIVTATSADINGDLDVDGHTNLDNVSVAGVTTFAGNTFVNDSFTINDTGSSTPLSITGNFGTGDSVYIQNNTSGGHVKFGLRVNDSDGNHHRAYITAERGTGATANGKLSILARRGSGTDFGWIIDSGVGIQANYNVIPETDSTHDLGTSSLRWTNVYADAVDVSGSGTFGNDINVANSIVHSGDTNTSIDYENDKISVKTGGTTRVSIANTGIILDDEVYINQSSSGMPLRIEGMLGSTENILLRNNTSGGHIQIGFRQNDSDGNHHRAYITAKKSATSGGANGQLELLARHGGGVHGGFIIDRGVGIKANLNIIPETDSTYDLGTSSLRWRNLYADTLYGDGSNLTGISAGTSLSGSTNNTVCTVTGANAITGEANLTYNGSSSLLGNLATSSTNNLELLRLENSHSDGKMTVMGFKTAGLGSPQTKIYGGNDNTGAASQQGDSGAGKFKVTITNPSGTHQEVIYAENDANTASKFIRLSTDGSERLRIKSDGKVLIGATLGLGGATSSPNGLLHAQTSSGEAKVNILGATNGVIQLSGYNGDSTINFGDASSDSPGQLNYDHGTDTLAIKTGGSERLRIKNDGKVVIGNSSGSGTGALTIYPNSITGMGRLDVYGGGDENSQTQARNEVMRIGRGDILDQYYHSIWSATGSGGSNSHFLKFYVSNGNAGATNQKEALSMNGEGYVTKVSQPRAFVKINSTTTLSNAKITNWASPTYNVGSLWNAANSRFIAPVDGLYLVGGNFRIGAPGHIRVVRFNLQAYNTSNQVMAIYGGGVGGSHNYDDNSSGYDHPYVSFTNVVYLTTGQYLELHCSETATQNTSYIQVNNEQSAMWCVLLQ